MGMFDHFPYTNFHELNLDWILQVLKEIEKTMDQFVTLNAIKYADPIQWDITRQYEKNTIVIDPATGTAYISVAPVPSGAALTRTEYWSVVFDLRALVVRAAKNFTTRYEADTTLTATFNSNAGDWLVWGDVLYVALVNITAGDTYVVGSNIRHITMEEIKNAIYQLINDNYDAITGMIGELQNLTTEDKSNLVAAINEVAAQVLGKIGNLDDLQTDDKQTLVGSINETLADVNWLRYRISPYTNIENPTVIPIPKNTLFWLNRQTLCEATTDIAAGDTLVDNVNYNPVTIQSLFANLLNLHNVEISGDLTIRGRITAPLQIGDVPNVEQILHRIYNNTNINDLSNVLTVGAHGCNYTTINDAIDAAKEYCTPTNRVLIWIMPGVYTEQIKLIPNPGIDFIGYGATVQGAYTYPDAPLYMVGKGFTCGIEFSNTAAPDTTHAYAFHCDAQDLQNLSDGIGYMKFYDCWFISRSHAGVGIGLGSEQYISFENCFIQNSEDNGYTGAYMHNYPIADVNYSYIRFKNCEINATSYMEDVQVFDEGGYRNHTAPFAVQFVDCTTRHRRGRFGKGLGGTQYTNAHDLAANASNFRYYPESNINPYGGTPFALLEASKFTLNSTMPTVHANNVDALYIDTPFVANAYAYNAILFEQIPLIADTSDPDYVTPSFSSYTITAINERTIQVVFNDLVNTRAIHYNIGATII